MQNIKHEAKILLSNHLEIIIGYVSFGYYTSWNAYNICNKCYSWFILLIIISIAVLILYNSLSILLLIFKLGYGYFYLLTDIKMSGILSCILALLLISSLIFFNFLYLRHFGCLIYFYFMDMNQSLTEVFKTNSKFFRQN